MSMVDDAIAGLAKGAAIGSVVPGIGTAIGGAAGGLIGVAMNVAPGVAQWLGSTVAVATKTAAVVQSVTGTAEPAAAQAALAADPGMTADLHVQLVQIANDARAEENRAAEARQAATNADVQNARKTTVDLAQAGSPLAWGAAAVSLVIALGFFVAFALLATGHVPDDKGAQSMLNMMVGALVAGLSSVIGYWLGSTAGSARKTNMLAQSVPAALLPKPARIEAAN